MRFVVVNGPPGSGKSTLASQLAIELDWPLIAKDDIKEALGDALDVGGQDWTQRLSAASFEVMWAVAARVPRAVLEGNFSPSAATRLEALDATLLEVFCRCRLEVCRDRFERRMREENRHRVHPAVVPPLEFFEQFTEPIGIGPVLEVDTEMSLKFPAIVEWINANR
jgi:adenylylsulfate kinase-like enzyme